MTEVERMVLVPMRLVAELAEWVDAPLVQGTFSVAFIHGCFADKSFSADAQRMWDEVRALAKEKA